jgi:branched-chain amino acid transport system substrate-binding protein
MQPVVERAGIPNITLTSKAIWEQGKSEFVFQTTPREEIEVKSILSFIQDELAAKKVAVIFDRQPYGTGNLAFIKEFAADFDIEIVAEEGIENNDTNADAQVNRVKSSGAEAVIVWVGDPAASSVAKALEQAQVDIPVIGSSAIAGPRFPELAGPAGEGVYSNGTLNYAEPPENQTRFLSEFQASFDSPPTQFAAFAYDAAFLLKEAIEEAGSTEGEAIAQGLIDMAPYEGVVATYDFEEDNHNGIPNEPLFYIVQVKDGQYQVVYDTRE